MRDYPHAPDPENQRENRDGAAALLRDLAADESAARAEERSGYFSVIGRERLALAAYSYAFEEPPAATIEHVRGALRLFLTGIEFGIEMDPFDYTLYLALAAIARDEEAIAHLAALPRERFTNPDVEAEEVVYLAAEATAALAARRREAAAERVAAAHAELTRRDLYPHDRRFAETLIAIAAATLANDADALSAATVARHEHARRAASHPAARELWTSLLDFEGLGLLALARDAGLRPSRGGIYLPLDLLEV